MTTPIDAIKINFNPDQLSLLNVCLAFIMFGVALDLRVDNFRDLLRRPKAPLVGLSSQLLLLPLLTLLLIAAVRPAPSIALGMLLVSACPGGNVSNFAVHISGANTALSVLMTSVSTLAAVVVTPLYFTFLAPLVPGADALQQDIYVAPGSMVATIVQLILLPLIAGMLLHAQFPFFTARLKQPVRMLSMAIFIGFVIFALYANFDNIINYLHIVFLLVFVHNALALLTGYFWAMSNRLPQADARAISIETGIQNSGLALILIFNFFDGLGGMALVAAFWGVWHLISAFSLAMWWQYRPIPAAVEK
ncbi:bile acid:sodium symporter family protein [Phaeodactylibacter luteus]|uniref:Bile acid:sodium symporter family protein n=1 Tax=Phaeodactylibacter luteus TaxID=1564516 RepID=A0A5C6RMX9_9BACT|nr:bile acid:sodium symporter family protein [Phaeodactylibacter luteus]TXB63000.1 bile acid:sodium symporter family protein [Phaeodactylibacter luteus]